MQGQVQLCRRSPAVRQAEAMGAWREESVCQVEEEAAFGGQPLSQGVQEDLCSSRTPESRGLQVRRGRGDSGDVGPQGCPSGELCQVPISRPTVQATLWASQLLHKSAWIQPCAGIWGNRGLWARGPCDEDEGRAGALICEPPQP